MTVQEFYDWCSDKNVENCVIHVPAKLDSLGLSMYVELDADYIEISDMLDSNMKTVIIECTGV